MREVDIAIIGGGPAGLMAADAAATNGASILMLERDGHLGGQLVKQTHKFFGSEKQYASTRGILIADILQDKLEEMKDLVEIWTDATALGMYEDGVLTAEKGNEFKKIKPKRVIVATGASEKFLTFVNNDLPGIYGAGAVQTLMNVQGVRPGQRVLMVGAGNIGLIVSYQLLQAGVEVAAIIDAAPTIGGYLVHASKIRRAGVPIITSHTVTRAYGKEAVEGATIVALDEKWQPVPGTEQELDVDVICISVGLSPLAELLWQAGCEMRYIPQLGGHVPTRDHHLKTSVDEVYIAGDVTGIEEASSAMVEGRLAGLAAAASLGYTSDTLEADILDCEEQLKSLRSGPVGDHINEGMALCMIDGKGV
ncbi:MAG TPA: FAD-dependent oxidoreductase [Clostridiaceae bacterium]|nr:FAD-dependent oxidoreductase [Clostridiaceae bacterium]